MIILSFIVLAIMLVWMLCSILAAVIGFCCMGEDIKAFCLCLGGIFSLVCWYQVLVWGEPWFKVLASAWL